MDANLLVKYGSAGYFSAKKEIHAILTQLGDQKEEQDLLVQGAIGVKTKLAPRTVIEELRELYISNPDAVQNTTSWQPIDHWCESTVDAIKTVIKEEIKDLIVPQDTLAIEITDHKNTLNKDELIQETMPFLKAKIDTERPQKILAIEVFGDKTAVSLLKQKDVFVR